MTSTLPTRPTRPRRLRAMLDPAADGPSLGLSARLGPLTPLEHGAGPAGRRHHLERVDAEIRIASELGLRWLRWQIPFHAVASEPGGYDWTWTDQTWKSLAAHEIEPIVELAPAGLPSDVDWLGDPRLPARHVRFVEAFVRRYRQVRVVEPMTAPLAAARRCTGPSGARRPGMQASAPTDERPLVAAIVGAAECAVRAMQLVRGLREDAQFVQSDVCERWSSSGPVTEEDAAVANERRFVAFDLVHGRPPSPPMIEWLLRNGLSESRLAWFSHHGSPAGCVVAHRYGATSERVLVGRGASRRRQPREGYGSLAREYDDRLGLPFVLHLGPDTVGEAVAPLPLPLLHAGTTTRLDEDAELPSDGPEEWLASAWDDLLSLRAEGRAVRGMSWLAMSDGTGHARPAPGASVVTPGLADGAGRLHPVGARYGRLAREARAGRFAPIGAATGSAAAR